MKRLKCTLITKMGNFDALFYKQYKYNQTNLSLLFSNKLVRLNFKIFHIKKKPTLDIKVFKIYFQYLLNILHNIGSIRNVINITYYECFEKKHFPRPGEMMTIENINSGYCYIYSKINESNIVIYRDEEFYKVMCHEMLHLYNIIPFDTFIDKEYYKFFKNVSNLNVNEALVELNALYINCIIISKIKNKSCYSLLKKEYSNSINLCKLLLNHYNISFLSILKGDVCFKDDNTNVFSYIFLKTIYFHTIFKKTDIDNLYQKMSNIKVKNTHFILMTINDIKSI